jgi:threonine/homoserine/homoserine lactone efflux protein
MTIGTLLRGIILGLSITAPIGPTNIEVIRRGTKDGWQAAVKFCLGALIILVLYLLLVTFGFTFLTESTVFNTLLTFTGVLVLAYLSYNSLRDFFTSSEIDLGKPVSGHQHFIQGVLLTVSNPAVLLLWTGIMGADMATGSSSVQQGFLLSSGILIGVTLFFSLLIPLVHFGRTFLRQRYLKYVSLMAGIVLFLFCIKFSYALIKQII